MDTGTTEEIIKAVNDANSGYWFPFTILATAFSVIIALLLYIWNQMIKNNNKRHEGNEKLLETAMSNQTALQLLVTKHKVKIENIEEKLKN